METPNRKAVQTLSTTLYLKDSIGGECRLKISTEKANSAANKHFTRPLSLESDVLKFIQEVFG
jgi:hypothetical protein